MSPESDQPTDPPSPTSPERASPHVLDASALLALVFDEPGAAVVADLIAEGAAVSAVNLSEVATVLQRHDRDVGSIIGAIAAQLTVQAFTSEDALAAAALWAAGRPAGLSLGDRACLALAQRLGAAAVTMDRQWASLDIGITIQLVRPPNS